MPYRVVIIGAGFGGIGMAITLKQAGIDDFVVLDQADDLGGTWRDNSYPGLSCDVPSLLYSFSFRPWRWSEALPARSRRSLRICTNACGARSWPAHEVWQRATSADFDENGAGVDGDALRRRTVRPPGRMAAVGPLDLPKHPDIPARDDFGGPSLHSGRWDHEADLAGGVSSSSAPGRARSSSCRGRQGRPGT